MSELLLELYSEEIPSRMQNSAISQLKSGLEGLGVDVSKAFVSPCRMVVVASFSNGTDVKELIFHALRGIKWPKLMEWDSGTRWIRPIRSILCLVDDKVLNLEFMGVKSSNFTFGHKTLVGKKLIISSVGDYCNQLEDNFVIVDQNRRKEVILSEVTKHIDLQLVDMGTVDEMVGLTEYPCVCKASFPEKFLQSIPGEIITTTIKHHQKCLMVYDGNKISNEFINVSNMPLNDEIISGYRRVVNARLSNAEFLYQDDLKKSLAARVDDLGQVIYHKELGNLRDKVIRIAKIAQIISSSISSDEVFIQSCILAGLLSKADLVSNTVKEFPELQGLIGYYLFLNNSMKECISIINNSKLVDIEFQLSSDHKMEIAGAIKNHYYPQGMYAEMDGSVTDVVALADKIDTICSFWSIGQKPTSSKDPFALRRMCVGIIKILLEKNIDLNLENIIFAIGNKNIDVTDILSFMQKRIEVIFVEQYLCKKKYMASLLHLNNPAKQLEHLKILEKEGDDDIESAYKRLVKFFKNKKINYLFSIENQSEAILVIADVLDLIDRKDFIDIEDNLFKKLQEFIPLSSKDLFITIGEISELVSKIFDSVNIGSDKNKLLLLQSSLLIMREFADFSRVEG